MSPRAREFDPATPSGGAVIALTADRYAEADRARSLALSAAIRSGSDAPIPFTPIPAPRPVESSMPPARKPCPHCGSRSFHKVGCPNRKAPAPKAAPVSASKGEPAPVPGFDPRTLTDEQLAACVVEARRRVAGREALAKALGGEK